MAWHEVEPTTPPGQVQILVLAQTRITGSIPLRYMNRSDELTMAEVNLLALDMDSGNEFFRTTSETIKFTAMNRDDKLKSGNGRAAARAASRYQGLLAQPAGGPAITLTGPIQRAGQHAQFVSDIAHIETFAGYELTFAQQNLKLIRICSAGITSALPDRQNPNQGGRHAGSN